YTYTAREYDYETGLYFYRARYYDPKAGRFITKDPISFAGGDVNLYNYVKNNPLNWIDPWGFHSITYQNGKLTYYNDAGNPLSTYPGTSGESGVTDPSIPWKGPIPPGDYTLNPSEASKGGFFRNLLGDWGDYRVPLHPDNDTNTYNRKNFFLHGGKKPGSAGCIDIGDKDKELFPDIIKHKGLIPVRVK
ncbi:MAG: RHS repeat-associated core domain-containing protein, partial [Smithella sp.]